MKIALRILSGLFSSLLCLVLATSCRPPASSQFLTAFDPTVTLNKIGVPAGLSYSKGATEISSNSAPFKGAEMHKNWCFSFAGSPVQLSDQLDRLRAEVESKLSSTGATISGRGKWAGDFSGFSFNYSSEGKMGFVRVTGVSFRSDRQGIEILVHEH